MKIRNLEVDPIDRDNEICFEVGNKWEDIVNTIYLSIDETKQLIKFLKEQIDGK